LAIGAQRIARRGAAVRQLSAVEVIGSVTVICTDKTGTLTENSLTVERFVAPDGSVTPGREVLLAAVLCNEATQNGSSVRGDPLDVALWRWVSDNGLDVAHERAVHPAGTLVPFDAHRRLMSVTCNVDGAPVRFVKGAPEAVMPLTSAQDMPGPLVEAVEEAAGLGERVLLLAAGAETAALDILGVVAFRDPPRQGVPEAIAACRSAGIRVVMLTGDHPTTALAIGRTIGLIDDEAVALDGHEVETMSDRALRERLRDNSVIARVNPEQKLRIVRALEQGGEIVVVTGDGINDAPALRAADVGVAMGRNGTEVAKQSGDIVLADDNFATIVAGIEEGRSIRANIRRFISYVFTSNVAEMVPFLLYIFLPIPLPLAVIQALAIDIGTDLLPALALGVEPPTAGTMLSAPERPDRPLLSRALGVRTFLIFGATEAALGMGGFFLYYLAEGWRFGDSFTPYAGIAHEATTLTFLAIVGGQVGCLFAQRDGPLRQRLSLSSNPSIRVALVFEIGLALLLVYVPGLNQVFSMAAVHPAWLAAIPVAAAIFTGIDQVRRSVPLEEQ
ncbi:MAG: cation-translocating P-type ATPase, partial [Dehalococcoidia bacterium]